jgi:hypothetical protein
MQDARRESISRFSHIFLKPYATCICSPLDSTTMKLVVFLSTISGCVAFQSISPISNAAAHSSARAATTRRFNFFKDMMDGAFQNDPTLSTSDVRKGMLEGPNSVDPDSIAPLTEVQLAWREKQTAVAAPMAETMLENAVCELSLYLAGVPSKDPSNDLYGSKVNISNRNKELGLDLPLEPNVGGIKLTFLSDGICRCAPSPFTAGTVDGEWKLSDDGAILRFSMDVLGYSRTVQTKGSIQAVFWSDEPEVSKQTSSEYNIPPGWLYGDIPIGYGNRPGTLAFKSNGVLRVEQNMGLLGVSSKLTACGTFDAKLKLDDL